MIGKYFTYNNESSEDYDLVIASLSNSNSALDNSLALEREVLSGTINRWKPQVYTLGTVWSGVLTFTIDCIVSRCETGPQQHGGLTEDELNNIAAWLTSPDYPKLFHMYGYDFLRDAKYQTLYITTGTATSYVVYHGNNTDIITVNLTNQTATCPGHSLRCSKKDGYFVITASNDNDAKWLSSIEKLYCDGIEYANIKTDSWITDVRRGKIMNSFMSGGEYDRFLNSQYDYFGVFSNIQPQIIGNEVIGLTLTFTTNSPFAYTAEKSVQRTGSGSFNINSTSAERNREVYPTIIINEPTISTGEKTVTIKNVTDKNRSLTIKIPSRNQYVIDCAKATIKDEAGVTKGFDDLGIAEIGQIYWPRLLYGNNTIQLTCSSSTTVVTFKWREPRKVGGY
jgi:hypothetical protein